MNATGMPENIDELLATLEKLPLDALQVVQWMVNELIARPDDDAHRKEVLNAATARMSALHSV